MPRRSNPDFLNGVPELLVLRMLARQPMHGYELIDAIRVDSREALAFGEGSIYPVLHRLEAKKLVTGKEERHNNRRRVVYHLTKKGSKQLAASVSEWQSVTEAIRLVLGGAADGNVA